MKANHQPCYVLHRRPYQESSLLVDIFSRNYGRLTLIAKGSRRKKSAFSGLITSFKPTLISWTGKGDLPILTNIEHQGYFPELIGPCMAGGFYMNELLLKLLQRFDPHENLYDSYHQQMVGLAEQQNPNDLLRIFEKRLLKEIGFGLVLDKDVETGELIDTQIYYKYVSDRGPIALEKQWEKSISGETLIALGTEVFTTNQQKEQAKKLMRNIIDVQLNGAKLHSRNVFYQISRSKSVNNV